MQKMTREALEQDPSTTFVCECAAALDPETLVWLELNSKTGEWVKPGEVPEEESQGCFTFGQACAKKKLKGSAK